VSISDIAIFDIDGRGRVRIPQIGPKTARSLLSWKTDREQMARSRMPISLDASEQQRIRGAYNVRLQNLVKAEGQARTDADRRKQQIRNQCGAQVNDINRQIDDERRAIVPRVANADQDIL